MNATIAEPAVPLAASPYDLRVKFGEKLSEPDVREALDQGEFGFVHSYTVGSAVDGPGMRLVVWLTGCQFQCAYCHNPDTWKMLNGIPITLTRAVEEIQKYRYDLNLMKGGLTISGGEPVLQRKFAINIFKACQKMGVHTAIDTNGYFGHQLSDEDLDCINLVMLGLKAIPADLHKQLTHMDNKSVHEFARRLAERRHPVWVRYVIVPGFTDNLDEVGRMADFIAGLGNVQRVDVLPFHQMGKFKWEKLGMDYRLRDAQPPAAEFMSQAVARFRAVGVNAF